MHSTTLDLKDISQYVSAMNSLHLNSSSFVGHNLGLMYQAVKSFGTSDVAASPNKSLGLWSVLKMVFDPPLPGLLAYIPFICRLIAGLMAAPLLLVFLLDIIAYLIARTLHLYPTSVRLPRSPPTKKTRRNSSAAHIPLQDVSHLAAPHSVSSSSGHGGEGLRQRRGRSRTPHSTPGTSAEPSETSEAESGTERDSSASPGSKMNISIWPPSDAESEADAEQDRSRSREGVDGATSPASLIAVDSLQHDRASPSMGLGLQMQSNSSSPSSSVGPPMVTPLPSASHHLAFDFAEAEGPATPKKRAAVAEGYTSDTEAMRREETPKGMRRRIGKGKVDWENEDFGVALGDRSAEVTLGSTSAAAAEPVLGEVKPLATVNFVEATHHLVDKDKTPTDSIVIDASQAKADLVGEEGPVVQEDLVTNDSPAMKALETPDLGLSVS